MIKRRTRRYLFIAGLTAGTVAIVLGLYFGLTAPSRSSPSFSSPPPSVTPVAPADVIFPTLRQEDFYQYIEMVDGVPVITDAFIAAVVNFVLVNMQIADGVVDWDFRPASATARQSVEIVFTWRPTAPETGQEAQTRAYHFTIG